MILNFEIDVGAFAAAYPIALPLQNFLRPPGFDLFNAVNQLFGVLRNAQEPLLDFLLHHRGAATPADSAGRLLVGKHRLFFRAPVDRRGALVREPAF